VKRKQLRHVCGELVSHHCEPEKHSYWFTEADNVDPIDDCPQCGKHLAEAYLEGELDEVPPEAIQ
jgi:hypothetical protein